MSFTLFWSILKKLTMWNYRFLPRKIRKPVKPKDIHIFKISFANLAFFVNSLSIKHLDFINSWDINFKKPVKRTRPKKVKDTEYSNSWGIINWKWNLKFFQLFQWGHLQANVRRMAKMLLFFEFKSFQISNGKDSKV